jgi:hypothetical protein
VINKYSLLYTLDGSDPSLSPLLVRANKSSALPAPFPAIGCINLYVFLNFLILPADIPLGRCARN